MKKEEDMSMVIDQEDFRAKVKQEFMLGENDQEPEMPDIRQMADTNGDFLKSINSPFGLTSPIQP